ncbi:MAG: polysaccharide deacetylase family protein [Verrucomicrobiota bacterium]
MVRCILSAFIFAASTALAQYGGAAPTTGPAPKAGEPRITFSSVNTDGPYIALTFDDGPGAATTPRLLDMLAKRNIKVTFFVLGECVQANPAILKREVAEGHEIGNHSWSHPDLSKMSEEGVRGQLQRTQDAVSQAGGVTPKVMRPPYGALHEKQRKWVHDQLGLKVILWEVDPNDWRRPGPSVIARRILEGTRNGSIILAHDIHAQTIDAMPQVLDGLLAKGFKFVTVSELLAMDRPKAKPTAKPTAKPSASAAISAAPSASATATAVPSATTSPAVPTKKADALPDSL